MGRSVLINDCSDGFVVAYEVSGDGNRGYQTLTRLQSGQDEVLSVEATMDICLQKRRIKLAFDSWVIVKSAVS